MQTRKALQFGQTLAPSLKHALLGSGASQLAGAAAFQHAKYVFSATPVGALRFYSDTKYKTIKVPHMADSITEGTLKSWAKQIGEQIEQDEEVASIETDKVDIPVNSPVAGVLRELLVNEEDTVVVGQDLFKIEEGAVAEGGAKPKEAQEAPASAATTESAPEPAAEQQPKQQVEQAKPSAAAAAPKQEAKPAPSKPTTGAASAPVSPAHFGTPSRSERRVKMNRMRLRIAERLKQSQDTAASLTTFNEIDMSNLIELRKTYKDDVLKAHGVKLGYMGAFVKASTHALQAVPEVNASIDGDHLVYYDYCDVSVAVATPKGLVTPVLRNTERMSIVDVEQEIANLGKKARDNKITVEDMAGGTFTISNGGVFGSLYGTPIINMPQAAILGMHAIKERPVVVNGKIEIRPMMYVALSYDHRIIDGREAVTFLVKVKEAIEDPRRLLLNV
ncbi:2-oxoglutarate dehydrogenase complex E2 component [Coemansia asiatica]|uniref:dihydrolipoyllysine-residue succinyltransferase n=1 Tax=Coemansia asiatica TaxID=1052880 RepID=A0A9W7XH68_9FUNG|nr:2-oxoglutarate dehydrogenase complex E2 component [Coemansia asiatica]